MVVFIFLFAWKLETSSLLTSSYTTDFPGFTRPLLSLQQKFIMPRAEAVCVFLYITAKLYCNENHFVFVLLHVLLPKKYNILRQNRGKLFSVYFYSSDIIIFLLLVLVTTAVLTHRQNMVRFKREQKFENNVVNKLFPRQQLRPTVVNSKCRKAKKEKI